MKKILMLFLILSIFSCSENKTQKAKIKNISVEIQNKPKIITEQKSEPQKKELKLTKTENEIAEVAISFHKWYIKNTDGNHNSVSTGYKVRKGENDYCVVDLEPYFKELRKLGTISEIFMQNERKRLQKCIESTENTKWDDNNELPDNCDDFDYWKQSQDFEGGNVEYKSVIKENGNWKVLISLFFIDEKGEHNVWKNANAKVEIINNKYMLTEINWIDN